MGLASMDNDFCIKLFLNFLCIPNMVEMGVGKHQKIELFNAQSMQTAFQLSPFSGRAGIDQYFHFRMIDQKNIAPSGKNSDNSVAA
jgi:hypothetical protein